MTHNIRTRNHESYLYHHRIHLVGIPQIFMRGHMISSRIDLREIFEDAKKMLGVIHKKLLIVSRETKTNKLLG